MFRIKICGLTHVVDALEAARAGADAIGLNFYPQSSRFIQLKRARQIVEALPAEIVNVGLFVNASAADVCRTFDQLALDLIQLHGDEPPTFLAELGDRPVLRAFRLGETGLESIARYLGDCRHLACMPRLVLVDAHVKGAYGGTGQVADWHALKQYPLDASVPPLVLAGGLTPENVAEAIRTVRPAAVDTASGVEAVGGRKSDVLIRKFVAAAAEAFKGK